MRVLMSAILVLSCGIAAPLVAQESPLVPERRAVIAADVDFPGSDLRTVFDTTLPACENACIGDGACNAFTFNARAGACFLKSGVDASAPYAGAYSGVLRAAETGLAVRARAAADRLSFLRKEDFSAALDQAGSLAQDHFAGERTAADLTEAARSAALRGDTAEAARLTGAAVTITDAPGDWSDYATALFAVRTEDQAERDRLGGRAVSAAVNAYLRADVAGEQATALSVLAEALGRVGRGRDMIPALRLAEATQPRDDTAAALEDAIGKYGFRIAETQVESDSADPRLCATFSEDLVPAGIDYATFVKLPEQGLSVEASGRQVCIGGVHHGQRYAIGFREGLPAASGEVLARSITITHYVRDRSPSVRFPGRSYVLPRVGQGGIPVETVNSDSLDLTLLRISDRNLVRAIQSDYFGRPLDYWSAETLRNEVTEVVWTGKADVAMEVNRDMTTLLPLDEVLSRVGSGIYALQAAVPGLDPYDHPAATQWFVVSDLGLTTLGGIDGLHVFVRGLADAMAVPGATVTLISRANAVIGTAETDDAGHALFPAALTAGNGGAAPALVTIGKGDDFAFLSLTEAEFDLSDRGVAGHPAAPPIDVFLATDRGAYRAGETIHATILARDAAMKAIPDLPLTIRLMRPDGVEYGRAVLSDIGAGGHVGDLPIAENAPRGTWRIEAFAEEDRILGSASVLVEDFLPERIDFTLALPEGAIRAGEDPALTVAARYLFGAPGAGLAIEGDVRVSAIAALDAFPGYSFGRYDEPFSPVWNPLADPGETDAEGLARIGIDLPDPGEAANRPLEARIALRLKEGSGRPVERTITRQILPEAAVIGIRPGFAEGVVPEGGDAAFDLIAVGPDQALAARKVNWRLNRLDEHYQWYSLYGEWNWEVTTTRTRIAGGEVALGAGGPTRISAPVASGNYELVVETVEGPYAAASTSFHAGWYVPADTSQTPDTLSLSLDRKDYRPGEVARLRIEPRAAGVALVTVLSNRLVDMKAVAVTAGENVVEIPVTDDWGAGVYVAASVIRPLSQEAGRAPVRSLGLSYASVDPGRRRLAARFEMAAEAAPRADLPVALKVEGATTGETVMATIAAVDVGILNLTGFAAPDPEDHYFGQRRLGVAVRDIYGRLIDGRNGAAGRIRSGGDAASGLKTDGPPPTEELVAYFSGPLTVGADGYARTSFDLPAFNGTVRLMAVVWSPTAVGQASADILVRDPVVVTASVPRFLAPGDESRLLLEIVHASGPAGRMALQVSSAGLAMDPAPADVTLEEGGKAVLAVPFRAPNAEGTETIRIALTTPDGRELKRDLVLPVQSNDPAIARQSRFALAPGSAFTLDGNVFAGLLAGSGKATLAAGPIARFDVPGLLASLDAYPYGCTEQLTSKALPLLYFEELASVVGGRSGPDIRKRVEDSIAAVLLNQSSTGAFGLWRADSGDLWLDAFVTDFLSRARAEGYAVPETAFRSALDNLRNQVNYAPDFDADGGPYAYALMVLAREGAAAVGDLRYFADVKAAAFDTPIAAAQMGAALAAYGDQRRADAMFVEAAGLLAATPSDRGRQVWRADYGTPLRDRTAVLALASEVGSDAVPAEALVRDVADGIAAGRLSTQEASWALLAAHAEVDRPGAAGLTVNGAPVAGPFVRVVDAAASEAPQVIANTSAEEVALTLTTFGIPVEPEPAGGKGYTIARSYFTLEGAPADIASVALGDRLVAVVEVRPDGPAEARLMVNDPLPAGFEIDNPSLIRAGDIAALGWLDTVEETRMTEFRQDRFLAALDWTSVDPFRLAYVMRAVSPGSFYQPAASVEDMYRPDFRARTATGRVVIAE